MKTSERLIVNLALKAMEPMGLRRRAVHYRALARITTDDELVVRLMEAASEMDRLDHQCRQMRLELPKGEA